MRRALALAGAGLLAGLVAGCASQTALLLPGEAGHPVGALVKLNKDGSECALNEPNEAIKGGCSIRHNVKVKSAYTDLIAGLPLPAQSFALTFALGADLPDLSPTTEAGRLNRATLDHIRDEVALRPGAEVQVTGHTDASGGPNFDNDALSRKRAENFREYLISNGFPADQVSTVGRGKREPIDPSNDVANRRIEVIVR